MRDIETKISPLIAGLFPSFYQSDGPNFITFIQAYYEWLEQNFQLLDLENTTNFNVGDTIQQGEVTGTIYSLMDSSILVLVDGLETFKCFNVCAEFIPVTSSSGGNTFIIKGGTTRRLGSIFLSRNLSKIRDIDTTLDLFVVRFKEKYLKNIEFDTQTNKRLLVKNSLDLYRSKGTSRSIDLFFRLIYGIKSSVYYPGDDLFRLSDAEWFKPQYIEINSTSVNRAITLVGKQITGVDSGATAFVERYVKKKINAGFVHVFYISNVRGQFLVNERLKYNQIYPDSPRIIGSFTGAGILEGSEDFNVGDVVNFDSPTGIGGIGRVVNTVKGTGEVSFSLANSGWGYTINRVDEVYSYSSNTFLSDKILTLANVESSQHISNVGVLNGGIGYSNTDTVLIISRYDQSYVTPSTNTTGGITSVRLIKSASGFFPEIETPVVSVVNSTNYASLGSGISLDISFEYPKKYFEYLEGVVEPFVYVTYHNDIGITDFVLGSVVDINNTNKLGKLIEIDTNASTMLISMIEKDSINSGDIVYLDSNTACKVDVIQALPQNTSGRVIDVSNTAVIELGAPRGTFAPGDVIYQKDAASNTVVASASITKTSSLSLSGGYIEVANFNGVFRPNANVFVLDTTATAPFKTISFSVAVTDSSNTFVDNYTPFIYSSNNSTKGYIIGSTSGSNAQYRIASLNDTQDVKVNTDRLSNNVLLNTALNATAYGLPYNPTANLSSIIFGALDFIGITLGSVATLGDINPGTGYNRKPTTSVYQPYVTGYQARDFIFTISDNETSYTTGEYVYQTNYSNFVKVSVGNTQPFRYMEKVYAGNSSVNFIANGVVYYINETDKYINLQFPVGTFPTTNNYSLKSIITTGNTYISNAVPYAGFVVAKGIVKDTIDNKVYIKRLQLDNLFVTGNNIVGSLSGTTANLVSIDIDTGSDPLGLNAKVDTKASTANGVISAIQVIDSGYGFSNDDELVFTATTDDRTGVAYNLKGGVGTGTGYYRSAKGFLSDISKVHDGDYYQEYSYDIISRIPIDKYASMFKKVMHTSGTRFFGSVLVDSIGNTTITVANTIIEVTDDSPYTIIDRQLIDIVDRNEFYIEIRE